MVDLPAREPTVKKPRTRSLYRKMARMVREGIKAKANETQESVNKEGTEF